MDDALDRLNNGEDVDAAEVLAPKLTPQEILEAGGEVDAALILAPEAGGE